MVGAGHRCDPSNYDGAIAGQLLPATLEQDRQPPGADSPSARSTTLTHPLFTNYGKDLDTELAQVPVYRYWGVKAQDPP